MRKTQIGGIAVAALLAAVGVALLAAAPAGAEVSNGCHASFAGHNLDGLPADRAHAIVVGKNDIVPMTMSRPDGKRFTELRIYYLFAGFDWDIYDAPAGGGTWSHPVDIHSFSGFGVGLYDLLGVGRFADGTSCDGEVYIKVSGDPLDSIAGEVGVAATAAGVLGMFGAGLGGGGGGGGDPGAPVTLDDVKKEEENQKTREDVPEDYGPEDVADDALGRGWCVLFSVLLIPLVLVLPLVFGRSALGMGVVAPAVRVRRRTWPLVVGPLSGVLTGVGAGVLLQQYAIVYPTRTYAIIYVAGGFLFGLAVPLLRRSFSR